MNSLKRAKLKNNILILVSILALTSCVTRKRCAEKFPPSIHTETIIRDTTIITEKTRFETIFNNSKDTVFLVDKETQIKIKYISLPGDSVFVSAECPSDTITITKEIITNNTTESNSGGFSWTFLFWILILGVVFFGGGYFIKTLKGTF